MTVRLFDTHTHLYDGAFDADGADAPLVGQIDAVRRAVDAGVDLMLLPVCELAELAKAGELARAYPDNILIGAGIHPENLPAPEDIERELARLDSWISAHRNSVAAVGETGMDLYWDKSRVDDQKFMFREHCMMALRHDLPVIIHCREAIDEVLDVIGMLPEVPRGVFHCFTGTADDLARIRDAGDFYIGIGGVLTFKKSALPGVVPLIPRDRILLETDSPYMAPVPVRGRRNESACLPYIAARMAEVLGLTPGEVSAMTTENGLRLFGR